MKKTWWKNNQRLFVWLLVIFLLGGLGGLIMQKYIVPALANVPVLGKVALFQPNAPLVITRTEQIRVNENVRLRDLIKQLRPKTVTVIMGRGTLGQNFVENSRATGLVISSDGVIALSFDAAAGLNNPTILVVNSDGVISSAQVLAVAQKSNVVLIRTNIQNLSPISFGNSNSLEIGEELAVVAGSQELQQSEAVLARTTNVLRNIQLSSVFDSEEYVQNFSIDLDTPVGSGIFNLRGELVGFATQNNFILPSEALRTAVDQYFSDQIIRRPSLGIKYRIFWGSGNELLGVKPESGIMVAGIKNPIANPLRTRDVILQINGENVGPSTPLDTFLNRSKPGDVFKFKIIREQEEIELEVILGEYK